MLEGIRPNTCVAFVLDTAIGHLAHLQEVDVDQVPYQTFSLVFGTSALERSRLPFRPCLISPFVSDFEWHRNLACSFWTNARRHSLGPLAVYQLVYARY